MREQQATFTNQEKILINAWLSGDEEAANCAAQRLSDLRVYRLPALYLDSLPKDTDCESLTQILLTISEMSAKTLKSKMNG